MAAELHLYPSAGLDSPLATARNRALPLAKRHTSDRLLRQPQRTLGVLNDETLPPQVDNVAVPRPPAGRAVLSDALKGRDCSPADPWNNHPCGRRISDGSGLSAIDSATFCPHNVTLLGASRRQLDRPVPRTREPPLPESAT